MTSSSPLLVPGLPSCRTGRREPISNNNNDPTIIEWVCVPPVNSLSLVRTVRRIQDTGGGSTRVTLSITRNTTIIATVNFVYRGNDPNPRGLESEAVGANGFLATVEALPNSKAQIITLRSNTFNVNYQLYLDDDPNGSIPGEVEFQFGGKYGLLLFADIEVDDQGTTDATFDSALITIANGIVALNSNGVSLDNDSIEIPAITMRLQTDLRGNNLDEAAFNVFDRVAYCSNYPPTCSKSGRCTNTIPNKRTQGCPIVKVPQNQVKMTEYSRNPIGFNKVVRGRGCTLKEKAHNINDTKLSDKQFMLRLSVFGMLKYILGKMMFGRFDLKWLLKENEREFFNKLKENRLCRFREAFDDPEIKGYGKYFR